MEFDKVIRERYSVRKYSAKAIEEDRLQAVLEAGNIAPTGHNNQPQRIYILKSEEALRKVRELTRCAFNAPAVLLFAYDEDEQWHNPFEEGIASGQQDVSIVACHMMLKAWDLGLGTCWVNYFPNSAVHDTFGLPEKEKAVLLMPIGYPADDSRPAPLHSAVKETAETVFEL
ncbi:MAG: nitroreductase family protein [Solobacterium sp.]|nr:nitroreductase family protein [Solobacterium sp.]